MTDDDIQRVFDDTRARHAVRIAMETIGRAFYFVALAHEQTCNRRKRK